MKDLVSKKGKSDLFYISSAATSTEEIGNPIYPPVRKILDSRGIDYSGKTAIQVTKNDYLKYDFLICMDSLNLRNLSRIIGEDIENKVYRLLDFTNSPKDVADPWYTGDFSITEKEIESGCLALYQHIFKTEKINED